MEGSKLLFWEVTNFMSIEHAKCEFDDRNIINIKGYNDSGKSAMLTALKILMTNFNPTKQVNFIQDDKDFFRILAVFSDGIRILRDKYVNGQSLYEMYKGDELIFSTKVGNTLTKVTEVPTPIADYLGLIIYDDTCINIRSCFEEQIGVQTKGSENYKMFNTVLKSEEIATAGELINNDRNKLSNEINMIDSDIKANVELMGTDTELSEGMITYLKEHDKLLDDYIVMEQVLSNIIQTQTNLNSIVVLPELNSVETKQLDVLHSIQENKRQIDTIRITPELEKVDVGVFDLLSNIIGVKQNIDSINVFDKDLGTIEKEQLDLLLNIQNSVVNMNALDNDIDNMTKELTNLDSELDALNHKLKDLGVRMITCPHCGKSFSE